MAIEQMTNWADWVLRWQRDCGFKYLWYGYTEDPEKASLIGDEGGMLSAKADGSMSATPSQNYFYLFVPRAELENEDSSEIVDNPPYNHSVFSIEKIKEVYVYTITNHRFPTPTVWNSFIDVYKVTISANSTESTITENLAVHLVWGPYFSGSSDTETVGTKTVMLTLTQSATENEQYSGNANFYYMTSDEDDNVTYPISTYTPIPQLPATIGVSFNKNSSEDTNINAFKYIYLRSTDTLALTAETSTDVSWASLQQVGMHNLTGIRVKVFKITVAENTPETFRKATLKIISEGSTVIDLVVTQYGTLNPDITIPTDADYITEDEYWDVPGAATVSAVDRNNGAVVDPTSVLYKSNQANIYSTIEQKDNTLFLGNYKNNNTINNISALVESALQDNTKMGMFYGLRRIDLNTSSSQYPYIPNLLDNSQQKRIFKKGEEYLLGLVFISNTGTWSTVHFIEKWSPVADPSVQKETVNGATKYYYNKIARGCVMSSAFTSELSSMGIIGVIPVYATKNAHNVKCQGFLSPTLTSNLRTSTETLAAQYSWFYRDFSSSASTLPMNNDTRTSIEIQNLDGTANETWTINQAICSLNTPEVEIGESLTNAELEGAKCSLIAVYNGFSYMNNVLLQTSGKYPKSSFSLSNPYQESPSVPLSSITDERFITGYLWEGFVNPGSEEADTAEFINQTNNDAYYKWYALYPWQRSRLGGEGQNFSVVTKRWFNSLYSICDTVSTVTLPTNPFIVEDLSIYRDFDTASLLRLGTGNNALYQGNVDYIAVSNYPYKAYTSDGSYPEAYTGTIYAGYNSNGDIQDPVSIKYKAAPHIAIKFNASQNFTSNGLTCVELYDTENITGTSTHDLINSQWIKCGDIKRIKSGESTTVLFEEGDYFFGRYDSLRTYCYTNEDVNSVVEVVSGMLCSRINLDSRCDRNRGGNTPTVSPQNFNIFNPVYNQSNNWFTFVYEDSEDIIYNREYKNSLQWSMVKNYSSDIDDWCNIQNSHTLDLDGDKGKLEALVRIGNNLMAFQDTGIAQIQYNEKTQVATTEGVPIEIANSGRVEGKYYIHDNIGCQDKRTIAKGQSGAYFIDNINKSIYLLASNGQIADLCTTGGMKSWALANIDDNWWSYYDINSQEIIFANEVEALAFSDSMKKFNAFLGYGNIRWNFRIADKMCQICTPFLKQVLSSSTEYLSSSERRVSSYVEHDNVVNTFWKKNSIDATKFFDNYSPVEIQLHCNPEPTLDKTFSTVEYRADCFDSKGTYLPFETFDTFRAWNEYQDTLETAMYFTEQNKNYANYSRNFVYRLKKKFRIWRIDIPRAFYGSTIYVPGNTSYVADPTNTVTVQADVPVNIAGRSRDRIRNPWCNIFLSMDTSKADKIVFNDLAIQYFK